MIRKKIRLSFSEAILTRIFLSTKVILLRSNYSMLLRRSITFVENIKIAILASEKLNLNIASHNSIKPASLKNTCRFLVLGIVLILNTSFLSPPSSPLPNVHAFHTSITEMRYNPKQKAFEISLRVFTDDLEKTLSAINQNKKIVIENNDKNDLFIEPYIRKHFAITTPKNQKLIYQFVGKEKEGDATWIYLEMPVNESIKGSKIQNDMLIDMFDDQTNIVNIFVNNEKKSFLFTVKNKVFVVEI